VNGFRHNLAKLVLHSNSMWRLQKQLVTSMKKTSKVGEVAGEKIVEIENDD
jgi:hypothetical protein